MEATHRVHAYCSSPISGWAVYDWPDPERFIQVEWESCRPRDGQEGSTRMTTGKRHSPEQVVRKLAQADRMLGEGKDVAGVCRELAVAEQTYYRWRNQFGGLKAEDAKRLKDLERENSTLKRLLADAELEKAALKEIARGNF